MTKEEIGRIIKESRIAAGLTQLQVADALSRPQNTVSAWEMGRAQPDANTLFDLFRVLGRSVDEAFGFSKEAPPLSGEAIKIAWDYARLDHYGKELVQKIVAHELERVGMPPMFYLKVFPYSVENLVGESELLGEVPEQVLIERNEWTKNVSFGLRLHRIRQNAHESYPRAYERNDILLVEQGENPVLGDWGLFRVDDFCCVLEYGKIQMYDFLGTCGNITIENCGCIGRIADVKLRPDGKLEKRRPIEINR